MFLNDVNSDSFENNESTPVNNNEEETLSARVLDDMRGDFMRNYSVLRPDNGLNGIRTREEPGDDNPKSDSTAKSNEDETETTKAATLDAIRKIAEGLKNAGEDGRSSSERSAGSMRDAMHKIGEAIQSILDIHGQSEKDNKDTEKHKARPESDGSSHFERGGELRKLFEEGMKDSGALPKSSDENPTPSQPHKPLPGFLLPDIQIIDNADIGVESGTNKKVYA
jgi:hypothetical protein